jgi:hypothetical protein
MQGEKLTGVLAIKKNANASKKTIRRANARKRRAAENK